MKYIILGTKDCPQCKNAKSFAVARKLDFEYLIIPDDISEIEAVKKVGKTFSSVPQIIADHGEELETLGSFPEFMKFANKNK